MTNKPNYFRIGIFVLLGMALFVGGLIVFGAGQFFKKRIYIETYVNSSVQGIDRGSPVKFRGIQIGSVKALSFAFNDYGSGNLGEDRFNYVVILMEIDKEMFPGMFTEDLTPLIEKNVKIGMRARIEPAGITGMNYIDINYMENANKFPLLPVEWKPKYYYIPSAPGQLASMLDSVNSIMGDLKKLNLDGVITNLNLLLKNLNKSITGAQLEKVSQNLQALIAALHLKVDKTKLGDISSEALKLIKGLEKSNADLQKILNNVEPATRLNPAEVRAVLKNLAATMKHLESFSFALQKRPSVLIWGSPAKEKDEKVKVKKAKPVR
ncbi:MAG: MlaD family protein [Chthoniobacterales bacterium]